MSSPNHKSIGSLLIAFAIILLFVLIVVKINTDKEEAFLCSVVEASPTLDMEECPAHDSYTSWFMLAAFVLSFLVLGVGMYLLLLPIKKELQEQKEAAARPADLNKLGEEELNLYNKIKLNQGSLYQSDLIKETGWSKVKISRILDKMEGKGVLERKRRGMTNIVVLK
ncbi:MAG: hypothetical protein Q8R53_00580 [Nanoarchaeota archaeon]|nr:hypothetical protein [Nanoarchaeota archaeon]